MPGNSKTGNNVTLQAVLQRVNAGQMKQARDLCQAFTAANPASAEGWFLQGSICGQLGEMAAMERNLRRALDLNPGLVSARLNLAICLESRGDAAAATAQLQRALQDQPAYVPAMLALAGLQANNGQPAQAVEWFSRVLVQEPGSLPAATGLAELHRSQGHNAEAEQILLAARQYYPHDVHLLKQLHSAFYDQGKFESARECCQQILLLGRDDGTRIREQTMVPVMADSVAHIDSIRSVLSSNIDRLMEEELSVSDPFTGIGYTSFQLAYHGRNDLELQRKLAALYLHACPQLGDHVSSSRTARSGASGARIRVGFISRYLRNHSIGKAGRGLLCNLSKERFETTALFLEAPADAMAREISDCADHVVLLENRLPEARRQVAALELDILFYQDIGMDPFTYFLAFARLAPVQCTWFGHPVTTGIPNMDYFITTDFYETNACHEHYSERLAVMHNVAAVSYCYPPGIPQQLAARDHFGLSAADHLYLCPQTLFKFHPEFDDMLAAILRKDALGTLLLKVGNRPHLATLLRERFKRSMPDVMDRIVFLPQLSGTDYMSLIACSDVMLDTPYFGGFTTSLDAFVAGTPIVTLPNELMRSRHTCSFYRKMDIDECTANLPEEYVRIANALCMDRDFRQDVKVKINERIGVIWEERNVIDEMERLLCEMVGAV